MDGANNSTRISNLRWQGLTTSDREHLVLTESEAGINVESVYISSGGSESFAAWYKIALDPQWRFLRLEAKIVGTSESLSLRRDPQTNSWFEGDKERTDLSESHEVDLSITPFTNTLPIRRLQLSTGESAEFNVAYIAFPDLRVFSDIQRYTRKTPKIYLFESVDTDFQREIEVDDRGLVVHYPDFFARVI